MNCRNGENGLATGMRFTTRRDLTSITSTCGVKLETIALDARLTQAWAVAANGEPIAIATPADIGDFSLANLGFQVRWRYELAPLSDLYIVYGRGGLATDEASRGLGELLGDATSLRDAEQLLIKISYRFAN